MKAADITDEMVYEAIKECRELEAYKEEDRLWVSRWDIHNRLPGCPVKVIDAKLLTMTRKGRLGGCSGRHNCRGDFMLPGES